MLSLLNSDSAKWGNVVIGAKLNGYYLDLLVKDAGIGMSSKDIDRLFTLFVQLDSSNTKKYGEQVLVLR
ncbi:Hypothetical protein Mbur_2052 [Methanococcoides burtonii DSM 6242]|uniref:Histidine kinase/HSP90-like ATPase domain-containing protein n=1 Tax=Methanococcoides burtonii (strain DSM 6242 / NBRC 107633 / OCM 468 / ACE-M) TaxID=259564 RepID=Q12UE8_METBU|nr:Hypothetical protein Mbur_2052 [Methanococcoides burtonii DSM 6242]